MNYLCIAHVLYSSSSLLQFENECRLDNFPFFHCPKWNIYHWITDKCMSYQLCNRKANRKNDLFPSYSTTSLQLCYHHTQLHSDVYRHKRGRDLQFENHWKCTVDRALRHDSNVQSMIPSLVEQRLLSVWVIVTEVAVPAKGWRVTTSQFDFYSLTP